jgi:segregation and condensation protein B
MEAEPRGLDDSAGTPNARPHASMDAEEESPSTDIETPQGEGDAMQAQEPVAHVVVSSGETAHAAGEEGEPAAQASAQTRRKRRSRSAPIEIDPAAALALVPKVEAILISCDRPLPAQRLGQLLGLLPSDAEASTPDQARTEQAAALIAACVRTLNQQLEGSGRAFRVELLSGGYRVMTLPEHADVVAGLHKARQQTKLSRAAIESLAVIAYRQPVTRAELESIRGVACGEVLRTLVERRLVTVKGRAEELGRPLIYGTTPQFLEHFGLASIKDLPTAAEGLTS